MKCKPCRWVRVKTLKSDRDGVLFLARCEDCGAETEGWEPRGFAMLPFGRV